MNRYCVGVTKIPHADRDVARAVLGDSGQARNYGDIIGSDTPDDDAEFPLGTPCTYYVELTDAEVEQFRAASNCRYVVPDIKLERTAPEDCPTLRTRKWMGQEFPNIDRYPGKTVRAAVLDSGTTPAVRSYMGWTLVARTWFDPDESAPPEGTIRKPEHNHGSLVAGNLVPAGGLLLDCNIVDDTEHAAISSMASGIRWACQNGAKVINCSFGGGTTNPEDAYGPIRDAIVYMGSFDCCLFMSAGNDGVGAVAYPAALAQNQQYAHAVIAFDEVTGAATSFTQWTNGSWAGVAPGINIRSVKPDATEVLWQGTSAASPCAAMNVVRLCSAGYSAKAASNALKATRRPTGQAKQSGGAYDMARALVSLGGVLLDPERPPPPDLPPISRTRPESRAAGIRLENSL